MVFLGGSLPSDQVKGVLASAKEAGIIVAFLLKANREKMLKKLKMTNHISALESLLLCGVSSAPV